jgi:hypothetical protein
VFWCDGAGKAAAGRLGHSAHCFTSWRRGRYPPVRLAIDRSFIRNIATDPENWGLADGIIKMGGNLSLIVVAQGVETRERAEFLRAHACDALQGFYFNRPLPHLVYQKSDALGFAPAQTALVDVGFTYDPGAWFVTADSNHSQDAYFGDFISGYISGGVRVGRFAPYGFYSAALAQSIGTSGLKSLGDQHTVAAGVRWDFAKNFDFKLQLEQVTINTLDDPAAFSNLQPGARIGDKAHVLSLALDFVF